MKSFRTFVLYKPYGVISQFSDRVGNKTTLGMVHEFPPDVYPIGRLDEKSEGLLIISNEPGLNELLLGKQIEKEYWVQVEGVPPKSALEILSVGVTIRVKKKLYHTLPASVEQYEGEPNFPPRDPPIRFRKHIPTSWLRITLREGKNRQIRKMTAAIGFPTLRLIRWRVCQFTLEGLKPGEVREIASPFTQND